MSSGAGRNARALTLLVVWSVALGALFAALLALAPAARAGTCDQVAVMCYDSGNECRSGGNMDEAAELA